MTPFVHMPSRAVAAAIAEIHGTRKKPVQLQKAGAASWNVLLGEVV